MAESSGINPWEYDQCPLCYGARFVHPTNQAGQPDFGRVIPCECTRQKAEQRRKEYLEKASNLATLRHLTFDNIMLTEAGKHKVSQEQFREACKISQAFAMAPEGWLVLVGPSGSGKTNLAAAIANARIARGEPVVFIGVADLLDNLYAAIKPDGESHYTRILDQLKNTPLLILDDLNLPSGPWGEEKLDQIIDYRFTRQLPTVITTSVPIDKLSERIQTRLADNKVCHIYNLGSLVSIAEYEWPSGFELQKTMTFQNFDYRRANLSLEQRRNLEQAYQLALEFARAPENWLVLLGTYGCGKTHLAAAVVNYRYQHHQPALFVVVPELLDHLRSAFAPESKVSYDQLFEVIKKTPLLVLDDFGEQTATPWAQEKLYQLINYRYNARLASIITTCRTLDELEPRISSRLADPKISTPFNIQAPDYRCDISTPDKSQRHEIPSSRRRGYSARTRPA